MNINESKAVMEKLDSLMSAAEEFGNQSEQLAHAKGSFDDYLAVVSETDKKMQAIIEKCNEYIESVQGLLNTDFSAPIKESAEKAEQSIKACKEQCEEVSTQFKEALGLFEQQRPVLEAAQQSLLASTEKGFSDEAELIQKTAAGLEEKTVSLLRELSDTADQVREELTTTVLEIVEQSHAELVKVKQESSAMQADLAAVKTEMEASKAWQIKNEMLIKVGVIAAAIAAVASIVNLFI